MSYAAHAAVGMVFSDSAESSSYCLHPEHTAGRDTPCAAIIGGCWHFICKWLNAGHGFLTEVDGERRMLQPQRFYKVIGQLLVVLFRHGFYLLVMTIIVSSTASAGWVNGNHIVFQRFM
jgi:hypothetical protein